MAPSAKEILIVDDDPDMVGAVYDVLASEGYAVTCAHNGLEALEYLQSHHPSLIILDLMMPVMDGWHFLSEKKRNQEVADVPVVVMSAITASPKAQQALEARAFIKKPLQLQDLMNVVERYSSN